MKRLILNQLLDWKNSPYRKRAFRGIPTVNFTALPQKKQECMGFCHLSFLLFYYDIL